MVAASPFMLAFWAGVLLLPQTAVAAPSEPEVPAPARDAGYVRHTFSTPGFTASNVDLAQSYARGFQWYLTNFFGTRSPSSAVTLNGDGSLLTLNPKDRSNDTLATIGRTAGPPHFVGTAFGCGGYFTATIAFDPHAVDTVKGWPSWWAMAAEHLIGFGEHWTGQAVGYDHFIEVDAFEFDREPARFPHSYGVALHDWYGVFGAPCPGSCHVDSDFGRGTITVPALTDFSAGHRIAMLWVPATKERDGAVSFFFDGLPTGGRVSWRRFSDEPPPPTSKTPWTFGILDQQHLALVFGSGSGRLQIRSVDVWQGAHACNLEN